LVSLVVVEHLLLVLLFLDLELFIVESAQFLDFERTCLFNLILFLLDEAIFVVAFLLLLIDLRREFLDLILVELVVCCDVKSMCVLVHLNISFELTDFFLQIITFLLLDQDFVADLDGRKLGACFLRLFVSDRENT